ncbi:hypothetical protein Goari_025489 [Gossypium aridum]|uniref:Uncharacterized protein n=1 Tax=Gossypium aridum TaxID=34290 RepID=A0A7J8X9J5_GOSAI|nr:hypothetical protein [Gossypium aridum]
MIHRISIIASSLYYKANFQTTKALQAVIKSFCQYSGQSINYNKSDIRRVKRITNDGSPWKALWKLCHDCLPLRSRPSQRHIIAHSHCVTVCYVDMRRETWTISFVHVLSPELYGLALPGLSVRIKLDSRISGIGLPTGSINTKH